MNCPKCGRENHDHAEICFFCRSPLPRPETDRETYEGPPPIEEADRTGDTRLSRLAVASCLSGILSIPFFILYGSAALDKVGSSPIAIFFLASFVSAMAAVICGIISLACIELKYGRLTGRAFAAIGIAVPLVAFFVTTARVAMTGSRSTASRLYCGTNLSGIGKAMLIYSNDYDGELPRAGLPGSKLGPTADWQADTRAEAFSDGQASMSANFYLLIKYAEVTPKSFRCNGDPLFIELRPRTYNVRDKELVDLWDFGPDPSRHVSFAYHFPYGPYPLTVSSEPGMAVAADRNPWLAAPGYTAKSAPEFRLFDPNGSRKSVKFGNAIQHHQDGQNVLFMDGHTSFEKTSDRGVNNDNIYTTWNGTDIRKGALPTLKSQPADPNDSLLLHDPPKGAAK